jgi:carbon storage regulator
MLVLTRYIGQSIVVGDQKKSMFTFSILSVKGSQIKIGVEAPKEIPVHREEIYERIRSGINKNKGI